MSLNEAPKFQGKVDSILFGEEFAAANAPHRSPVETKDEIIEDPTPEMAEDVRDTIEKYGSKRLNFYDDESDDDYCEDVENPLVVKLKSQLEETKTTLKTERTNRKRKEKSLIKLAKELNARSNTYKEKDMTIDELEETIADLTNRLSVRNKQISELPTLRAAIEEKEKALNGYREVAHSHLLDRLSQTRLDFLPPLESVESKSLLDDQTASTSPLSASSSEPKRTWTALIGILALLCVAGTAGTGLFLYQHHGSTLQKIACAPVAPGTHVSPRDDRTLQLYSAPFWVPLLYKRTVFEYMCSQDNPRVTLRWQSRKLQIVTPTETTTFRTMNGFTAHYDSITLHQRVRDLDVPAPWWPARAHGHAELAAQ